jgi:mono/diheme cytochrome c family protein
MRHASPAQAVLAAALAGAFGIAPADAASAADESAAPGLEPATAAAVTALMPALPSAGEGRRTFLKLNCYGCHGAFAGGSIGPGLAGVPRSIVEFNVLNGNAGGMPSFADYVDETDITNLANYFATIGTSGEPTFFDWWKKVPKK